MWLWLGMTLAAATPLQDCEQTIRDNPDDGATWRCLASVARQTGELDEATRMASTLLEAHPTNPYGQKSLGVLLCDQGDCTASKDLWLRAVDTLEERGELRDFTYTLFNLAANTQDFDEALEYLTRAAEATREKDANLYAMARVEEATLRISFHNNNTLALKLLEEARPQILSGDRVQGKYRLFQQLSSLHIDANRIGPAIKARDELLKLAQQQGNRYVQSTAAAWLAVQVYRHPEDTAFIHEGDPVGWVRFQLEVAKAAQNIYAEQTLRRALAVLLHPSSESKALVQQVLMSKKEGTALESWTLHTMAEAAVYFQDQPEQALAILEESNQLLPSNLQWKHTWIRFLDEQGKPEQALTDGDRFWSEMLEEFSEIPDPLTLQADKFDQKQWTNHYLTLLARDNPELSLQRFDVLERLSVGQQPEIVDIPNLQSVLGPEEALVILRDGYFHLPNQTDPTAWIVTHDNVEWIELSGARPLRSTAEMLGLAILEGRDTGAALEHLDNVLLKPIIRSLDPSVQRVGLQPAGWTQGVPWATLPSAEGRLQITRIPHLEWVLNHWNQRIEPGPVAAIVDPVLPSLEQTSRFKRLPRANEEGDWLAEHLNATVLRDTEATERAATNVDSSARLLHIGAHAVINGSYPSESGVLLSPEGDRDGMWTTAEITQSDQTGRVIVLAACRGANSPLVDGEGPRALADAFLEAGAQAVVAHLWPIRDDHALAFNTALYTELAQGSTVGDALDAARAHMQASGMPMAAWAGVVLLGDAQARPVLKPTPRPVPLWARIAGFCFGVLLLMWVFGRASRRGLPI